MLVIWLNIQYYPVMAVNYEISQMIRDHRKAAGLSQKELGELAGLGKTVIYDLEKGKRTVKWETLLAVLHALNIRINFNSPLMDENEIS